VLTVGHRLLMHGYSCTGKVLFATMFFVSRLKRRHFPIYSKQKRNKVTSKVTVGNEQ